MYFHMLTSSRALFEVNIYINIERSYNEKFLSHSININMNRKQICNRSWQSYSVFRQNIE